MDPVSAFSLAGTILQFIDFGSKILGLAWQLYQRNNEGLKELEELNELTKHMHKVLHGFGAAPIGASLAGAQYRSLVQLSEQCVKVGTELMSLLEKLGVTRAVKRNAFGVLKTAFQIVWDDAEIKSLQSRVSGFRSQLNLELLILLRSVVRPL